VATPALERALRSARGTSGAPLGRLPFSGREAEAIAALTPTGQAWKATGFEASRDAATSQPLADYRIVHFATHGLLNTERPELSGLVLSLLDRAGRKQDGFLRLHDVYDLELAADLVVLSGCQTALGKELSGEGLVGLTRGLMYAGARSVVASLWQVDDESTAELMKRFYRAMLKEGLRPAEALRLAQLEMSRDRRWSAPFYWAGFVLQGEWR
jgi:CHAT domain-containing protein